MNDPGGLAGSVSLTNNYPGSEWCDWCGQSGWIELAGTDTIGGIAYSRGMTACKWCTLGMRVFAAATRNRLELASNFTEGDVHHKVGQPHVRPKRTTPVERGDTWADAGYVRLPDGSLINATTGEPVAILPPERNLPPLPQGGQATPEMRQKLQARQRHDPRVVAHAEAQRALSEPVTADEMTLVGGHEHEISDAQQHRVTGAEVRPTRKGRG